MTDYLPQDFLERMKEMLKGEYEDFLASYEKSSHCGLRVNTLKVDPQSFDKLSPFKIEPVPWIWNGFYYDENDQPAKHPYYYAGLYYIQEPSAMTPASILPVTPGDRVLDICAAPGGKSTELAARLKGEGVLVSNDISNSRAKALLKNIEISGVRNAIVMSEAPSKLEETFDGYFDCILVDAPCSGEGMFRKSHSIVKNWQQYGTGYYAKLQREILPCAVRMLRPGGYLLYSTCTFSPDENEGTLKFVMESFPDMHVVPIEKQYAGFSPAHPEYVDGPDEIKNAVRIYPHKMEGEGHFVALMRKDGCGLCGNLMDESESRQSGKLDGCGNEPAPERKRELYKNEYDRSGKKNISAEAFDFLERIRFEIPKERIEVRDERLYLMPEGVPSLDRMRILRSGLLLGEMKKGRFEPSQALASALNADEYDNVCNVEYDTAIRYLKCESILLPENVRDGYVLICTDGFPLGWGKCAHGSFKNKYLPGWRMM